MSSDPGRASAEKMGEENATTRAEEDMRMLEYGTGYRSEPFSQTPGGAEPWVPAVVDFYVQHHTPHLPEIDGPDFHQRTLLRYMTIATKDPILFNAIIAFASTDLAAKQPASFSAHHALLLKGRALHTINSALSDPRSGTNDPTIAAVVIMAGLESIYHDLEASKAHMRGARKMIQLRGGLNALGYGGMFKRMFVYVDLAQSMVTHERFFEDIEEGNRMNERPHVSRRQVQDEIDAPGSTALVGFLPRPRGYCTVVIHSDLWQAIRNIYDAVVDISRRPENQRKQMDLAVFRNHIGSLAEPLLLYTELNTSTAWHELAVETRILLSASLRSILAQLWRLVDPSPPDRCPVGYPATRIVEESVGHILSMPELGDEVIWSLFTIVSDPGWNFRQRADMVGGLRRACQQKKLLGWKKILALLRRYIYFAAMQKAAMMQLWREMSAVRDDGVLQDRE